MQSPRQRVSQANQDLGIAETAGAPVHALLDSATVVHISLSSAAGTEAGVVGRQEEATSSASFDSWHSRNRSGSGTSASTTKPADATAAGLNELPDKLASAQADAEGSPPR